MSPVLQPPYFAQRNGKSLSLQDYEKRFDTACPMRGEVSNGYSMHPRRPRVPERIRELVPSAKFIYLVRDPIDRAVAHYMQRVETKLESRPLKEALAGAQDEGHMYACGSRYAVQLERYMRHFPESNLLVIDQVELRESRPATLRKAFAFLGVDPAFVSPGFDQEHNLTRNKRQNSNTYAKLRTTPAGRAGRRLPRPARRPAAWLVKRAISGRKLEPPTVDDGLRAELASVFGPDVQQLRALTGKPFSNWSV